MDRKTAKLHTGTRSKSTSAFTRWIPRQLEQLEDRLTPAITITNSPTWTAHGPTSVTGGEVSAITNSPVIGAISALATDLSDVTGNTLYAGGANGGVWKSINALNASPTWTPLTDSFPSLSISALAINPDNNQQILAGIGGSADGFYTLAYNAATNAVSNVTLDSRGQARGDLIGALYSQDGGQTWAVINDSIGGKKVTGVAVRNTYLLVATDAGLYRSTNSGRTFTQVAGGLVAGGVYDLAADPGAAVDVVASATWLNGVATITLTTPHTLTFGQTVVVTGVTPGGFNGTFTVTGTPTTSSFTYNLPTNPGNLGPGGSEASGSNSITSATWNAGVATITTAVAHNVVVGENVNIVGVSVAGYNGNYVVTGVLNATQFTYARAVNPGAAGSGGLQSAGPNAIAAATWNAGVATITTNANNNLAVGETVVINGVALPGYNGRYVVASIISPTQFTYNLARNPGDSGTGGSSAILAQTVFSSTWVNGLATITTASPTNVTVGQTVTIAGNSRVAYNGTFVVTSVLSNTVFTYSLATNPAGAGSGGTATIAPASISAASWAAGAVTITTASANGVRVGDIVTIGGITPAGYNGVFTVTAVLSPTQYTYALATDPGTTISGGTESQLANTDPQARNRFYAAVSNPNGPGGLGVFITTNGGLTWTNITTPLMEIGANTTNVQIAVFNSGIITDNIVYVAVENDKVTDLRAVLSDASTTGHAYAFANRLSDVSTITWSPNQGGVWSRMDAPRVVTEVQAALPPRLDGTPAVRVENGFVTVSTGGPLVGGIRHHLRDGDVVQIAGVADQGNGTTIPRGTIIGSNDAGQDMVNGIWFIDVVDEYTFRLLSSADDFGPDAPARATFVNSPNGGPPVTGVFLLDGNGNPIPFNGGTWQQLLGANAGERSEFFDLVADPNSNSTLYLGTDRADPAFFANSVSGYNTFTGTYWRGNRLANPSGALDTPQTSNQWVSIVNNGTTNGSAPPADSHDFVIASNGTLIAATGGGIYSRTTPLINGAWASRNGNLDVSGISSVGYDSLNNVYFAGTIDTQAIAQSATNSGNYTSVLSAANVQLRFQDQANVFKVLSDNSQLDNFGNPAIRNVRYYIGTNFSNVIRQTFNNAGTLTGSANVLFASPLNTTQALAGLSGRDSQGVNINENVRIASALNQNDQRRALFGYNDLYEDADPSGTSTTGSIVNTITPLGKTGHVASLVYGGKLGGINFNQIVYMTTDTGELWFRELTPNFANLTANLNAASGQTGAAIFAVVSDPDDYRHIYVAQGSKILESKNAGLTFTDISANLIGPETADGTAGSGKLTTQIRSLAVFDSNPGSAIAGDLTVLAGGRGGVFRLSTDPDCPQASWSEFGQALPNTVVNDLQVINNQRLIAGTAGRGIWTIDDISTTVTADVVLTIDGTAGNDTISVTLDPNNPSAILVTENGVSTSFTRGTFTQLAINGLGGTDTIQIGNGDVGFVNFHIDVNGGGNAGDRLNVDNRLVNAATQTTVTGTTIGSGVGDTIFAGCANIAYVGFNSGTIQVSTGGGADTFLATTVTPVGTIPLSPGTTIFTGGEGGDSYNYAMSAAASSTLIIDELGLTGTDRLTITGSAIDDAFTVGPASVALGNNFVSYNRIENFTLSGGLGNDTFAVNGISGTNNTFNGDGGNDNFSFNSGLGSANRTVVFNGGIGADTLSVTGSSSNDTVGIDINTPTGNGAYTGLRQAVAFNAFESLGFDGAGGTNAFAWRDRTNTSYGVAATPETGVVYTPTSATAGNIRINTGAAYPTVFFSNINSSLVLDGDADRSGDQDILTVQGFSTAGLQSGGPFNESASGDGSDTFVVNDQFVTTTNAALGAARTVNFGSYSNGTPTFKMIYVRGGNEAVTGDRFTVTPSLKTNIVVNGNNPTSGSAADQLTVLSKGLTNRTRINDPLFGPPQTRVVQTSDGASMGYLNIETITVVDTTGGGGGGGGGGTGGGSTPLNTAGFYFAASDVGAASRLQVFDRLNGVILRDFSPFGGFAGGIHVATGDINGDGTPDIVVSAGPGAGPHVKIYSGIDFSELASFFAYDQGFLGGVDVAVGDLNGDGYAEIITGTGAGAGPHIKVFDGITFKEIDSYYAFDPGFVGGITVAVGDVNGDGTPDLIVGARAGAEPRVTVFSGKDRTVLMDFFAFDVGFTGGVFIACGDVNGDGFADVIIGAGGGGVPQISVVSGRDGTQMASFLANDAVTDTVGTVPLDGGVRVASVDFDNDGIDEILTAKGRGTFPILRFYKLNAAGVTLAARNQAFDNSYANGVYVGG